LPITIRDVAKKASVSIATVSRVLHEKDFAAQVAPATRRRVLDAVQELGYRPNLLGRVLRTQRTGLIGVIIRDVGDPFHGLLIKGIDLVTRERGYRFLLSHVEALSLTGEYAQIWKTYHGDGMIVVGDVTGDESVLKELLEICPYTVVTGHPPVGELPRVIIDNRGGIRAALAHLCGLGHRHIGFAYDPAIWDMRERYQAFLDSVNDLGLPTESQLIVKAIDNFEGGVQSVMTLCSQPAPPTAIVLANDRMALGALHAAQSLGLHIPEDISIVGFDDIPYAAYSTPSLTTIQQPILAIGNIAVNILLDWLEGRANPPLECVVLPVNLVIRASTAPPRTRN
jgi:DNA-binding LacI/PurR family transcriptional regulator